MRKIESGIADLFIIELDIYRDNRGFFVERFNSEKFTALGINSNYVQDNCSRSIPGVIRGLHYQNNPSQAKLVGCTSGAIWDVAVDIRPHSKTFGKYFAIELSGENGKLLYIPEGFAHGFCVIGDKEADVIYKVNARYSKEGEGGIFYNDPDLNIAWPIQNAIISDRDQQLPSFRSWRQKNGF